MWAQGRLGWNVLEVDGGVDIVVVGLRLISSREKTPWDGGLEITAISNMGKSNGYINALFIFARVV